MNVELPSIGCNILQSSTTFYNYSPDNLTRSSYIIYDGVAHLQRVETSNYAYAHTGTCMHTGDLVYKPEYKEFVMPFCAFFGFVFILGLIYKIIIKRLLP